MFVYVEKVFSVCLYTSAVLSLSLCITAALSLFSLSLSLSLYLPPSLLSLFSFAVFHCIFCDIFLLSLYLLVLKFTTKFSLVVSVYQLLN
jgi:hypothetical protein